MNAASGTGVSIVIPTKNAGPEFRATLEAIRRQSRECELLVVDSGSSDGTPDLARKFGARIISIAPESFNHGETRNLGVRQTSTPFCVMLVQDALPVGDRWLEEMLTPFSDERVVGVTVQQVPRPDSDPIARWQVEYRLNFLGNSMRVQELDSWSRFLTLTFQDRLRLATFDNVCSVVRRNFWDECPFRPVAFAEDLDWGVRAIAAGRRLVYNPRVSVIHSHNRPAAYHLKRSYISGRVVPKILHMEPIDKGTHSDKEFLALLGNLCGEAKALASTTTDWREFSRSCDLVLRLWDILRIPVRLRHAPSYRTNGMRTDFYFIIEQLMGPGRPPGAAPSVNSILPAALAEAAGSFAAGYYNWCELRGSISDGMRRLDEALSKGV